MKKITRIASFLFVLLLLGQGSLLMGQSVKWNEPVQDVYRPGTVLDENHPDEFLSGRAAGSTGSIIPKAGVDLMVIIQNISYPIIELKIKSALVTLVDSLPSDFAQVGVVTFGESASLQQYLYPLSTVKNVVKSSINNLSWKYSGSLGNTLGPALTLARNELTSIRSNPNHQKLIILIGDSAYHPVSWSALFQQARGYWINDGITIHTVAHYPSPIYISLPKAISDTTYGTWTGVNWHRDQNALFGGTNRNLINVSHVDIQSTHGPQIDSLPVGPLGFFKLPPVTIMTGSNGFSAQTFTWDGKISAPDFISITGDSISDLDIILTDFQDPVEEGGKSFQQQVKAINWGPDYAKGVWVSDTLSPDLDYVGANPGKGSISYDPGTGVLDWQIGDLGVGDSAEMLLDFITKGQNSVYNNARIGSNNYDDSLHNNYWSEDTEVEYPDLSVWIEADPQPVITGNFVVYSVRVKNQSPAHFMAYDIVLRDSFPGEMELKSYASTDGACTLNNGIITCLIDSMQGQETVTLLVTARAPLKKTYIHEAEVSFRRPDQDSSNNFAQRVITAKDFLSDVISNGCCPNVVVDYAGNVHLLYKDDQGELVYRSNATGLWVEETLFNTGWIFDADLALDTAGKAHVVYTWDDNGESVLIYTHKIAGAWSTPEEVVKNMKGAWSLSLDIAASGDVHLVYLETFGPASQGDMIYLSNTGSGWVSNLTASDGYDKVAMALDHMDNAHICYYSPMFNSLRYVTNVSGSFVFEQVDTVGGQLEGMVTDIVVDKIGNPHISYVGGPLEDHRYATKQGGTWQTRNIQGGDFQSAGTAIAVDNLGDVYIIYYAYTDENLRYSHTEGGVWRPTQTIDDGGFSNDIAVDGIGGVHFFYENKWELIYAYNRYVADTDYDGVIDPEEYGPARNDTLFDGNQDGIPDYEQGNVTSLHTNDGLHYITLSAPDSLQFIEVKAIGNPSPTNTPIDEAFDFGFFRFTLIGLEIGGAATVVMDLHGQEAPKRYWKYGATPDSTRNHWYEFDYDGQTGAEVNGSQLTLHLVDGLRGDHDLEANSVIREPGGPGFSARGIDPGLAATPFALYPNYPNPFADQTTIPFRLEKASRVKLSIHDMNGRELGEIMNKLLPAGEHAVIWQAEQLPAGLYFYRLEVEENVISRKMILMR